MSDLTDETLSRYLDQQPGMREALLHDPAQHMQVEALRRTLDMVDGLWPMRGCRTTRGSG